MTTINTIEDLVRILRDQPTWAEALRALLLTDRPLNAKETLDDLLDDPEVLPDAYHGAVLLSDQIEFYIKNLEPPLLQNANKSPIFGPELDQCLDTASYKLRLGDEAHVGGEWVKISRDKPLVLPPHQVAVVKTHEIINIPRFLIARWNLRVQWVYEGLLWTGGPQVDPGWRGALYCPIYNLAERQLVIPHKERVFTMDFTRTTPFHDARSSPSYEYKTKPHKPARDNRIQAHDVNRLRSAPFESLRQLATLNSRVNSFISLTFLVLAVMIAAIGVIASLSGGGSEALNRAVSGDSAIFVLTIVALVFGFSGLMIGSSAMALRFAYPPRGRIGLTLLSILGALLFGSGAGLMGFTLTSGAPEWWPPEWLFGMNGLPSAVAGFSTIFGFMMLCVVWWRATASKANRWF